MTQQSLFEKLQISTEKNFLIQGLPSSIEKQFIKLSYSKNVTPLLRIKKIDFALVFAINGNQLSSILKEVIPNLSTNSKLWVAFPKSTSKIASDLNRACNWEVLGRNNYESVCEVTLDHVWSALLFAKTETGVVETEQVICAGKEDEKEEVACETEGKKVEVKGLGFGKKLVVTPAALEKVFSAQKKAREVFQNLSSTNQEEYVAWIEGAKREDTKNRRLEATVEKLLAGKKSPLEK